MNKNKQIRALMPNLIHSLDAASLALFSDLYFTEESSNVRNFFAVHDCFAVTLNNIHEMINKLKIVYCAIYSKNNYLINFDKGIRYAIKSQFGEDSFDDKTRIIKVNNLILSFPNIYDVIEGKNYSEDVLLKSSYIVS
jgi:DNA-directed RNA polymerase